jgi:hypothetical protein
MMDIRSPSSMYVDGLVKTYSDTERSTLMLNDKKYIGMDVHKESISIVVRNDTGKIVKECVIETKDSVILWVGLTDVMGSTRSQGVMDIIVHVAEP